MCEAIFVGFLIRQENGQWQAGEEIEETEIVKTPLGQLNSGAKPKLLVNEGNFKECPHQLVRAGPG